MTDQSDDRLQDNQSRFNNRFERNRLQDAVEMPDLEGSTRLSDRPTSRFQLRRLFRIQQRQRIGERRREFAEGLELADRQVAAVQLDDRGERIGFAPTESGRESLAERFANQRPFVEPDEALVETDPLSGVEVRTDPNETEEIAERARTETASDARFIDSNDLIADVGAGGVEDVRTAPERRDDVAAEVRQETAEDAQFIEPRDLQAEVGPRGVEGVQTAPDRRDDIAERARTEIAADDPFAEPDDINADVGARGVTEAGFTEQGERRRAAREFADRTPVDTFEPSSIRTADDGFRLTESAQRRVAARSLENNLQSFERGELDPSNDVRQTDDGFGLTRDPAREAAADQIDRDLPDINVAPDDIQLEDTGTGFEGFFEREVER